MPLQNTRNCADFEKCFWINSCKKNNALQHIVDVICKECKFYKPCNQNLADENNNPINPLANTPEWLRRLSAKRKKTG